MVERGRIPAGHMSPLERAKASYRPMLSIDELLGLEREKYRVLQVNPPEPTPRHPAHTGDMR